MHISDLHNVDRGCTKSHRQGESRVGGAVFEKVGKGKAAKAKVGKEQARAKANGAKVTSRATTTDHQAKELARV